MKTVRRAWRAICALFAPPEEIHGCRNCKWAGSELPGGRAYCYNTDGYANRMGDGYIYLGNPYRAEQCGEAYERWDGE